MTQAYSGMRKGITLVEVMVAVILIGVVSIVGYKYYKNFYNTNLTSKKARVAALMEQATQLSNAYDVYKAQFGQAPAAITDLTAVNVKILTSLPTKIAEIGSNDWTMDTATDYTGASGAATTAVDTAFTFDVNAEPTATSTDNEEYCAILNNMIKNTESLSVTDNMNFGPLATDQYPIFGNAYCYGTNDTLKIVFIKQAN